MKQYSTGMVFGIYDRIDGRHALLLWKAARLCDVVYVAVSSDEEVESVFDEPSRVPLNKRKENVSGFCKIEGIETRILADENSLPVDFVVNYQVDSYILSSGQYERFGKELEIILETNGIKRKIEIVK